MTETVGMEKMVSPQISTQARVTTLISLFSITLRPNQFKEKRKILKRHIIWNDTINVLYQWMEIVYIENSQHAAMVPKTNKHKLRLANKYAFYLCCY